TMGQKITWAGREITPQVQQLNTRGIVDLQALYPEDQFSVAYAYCEIQSDQEQPVHFFLGHDDCAKMWLNDSLIHRVWSPDGMGIISRQFHLTGKLKPGPNRILLKVENWGYDWGFQLEAFNSEAVKPILQAMAEDEALAKFQGCHPQPKGEWDYMIAPGAFPEIVWNNPQAVAAHAGDAPMTVQWFNATLDSVDGPIEPGRYIAYVTFPTRDGKTIRRQVTVFCRNAQWLPWYEANKVYPDYFANSGFDRTAFEAHKPHTAAILGGILSQKFAQTEAGALVNCYWQELTADKTLELFETPDVISNDIQVKLKQKILNISPEDLPAMPLPKITKKPARILHSGTTDAAEVKKDAAAKLRQLCQEWYEESGEPFNIMIARHGVIVLHEAFGPCEIDQKFSVASITKAVAGLTFARFVDTGLIDIDTPVGQFLPDFPTTGEKAMT
ncbi:serine hydrolase, partial [bacterium]|nr:serine hydrolase [bacterium]